MFQESQQIGVYTLIKKLGEGGFGEVWLAENRNLSPSEKVAIKLPRKEQIDLQTFKEEIFNWNLAGKHNNILPIIECETFGNQIAIVSEYAPDGSLQDLINKKGALSIGEAVEITIGILDGLAHLHNRKIIHRDLKPDNVLFQRNVPRLTDFGISRALSFDSQSKTISGTLSYMAPEAFDGKRNAQTDIWAVGVILYQLLTGQLPFPQKERVELIGALVMKEPAPLSNTIPLDLKNIVKKSLAKEVSKRYQTAKTMGEELKNFRKANLNIFPPLPTEPSIPIDKDETIPFDDSASTQEDENPFEKPFEVPPSPPKPNPKWHYFAIPTGLLLLFAIFGGYWFSNKTKPEENPAVVDVSTVNIPTPSPTATPLQDKNGETLLIPFRKGDKWGFSDSNKKIIIEAKYDSASRFSEDLAAVSLNKKYGFVDKTGNEVIPPKYQEVAPFSDGLAWVFLDKKVGFIDKAGKEIIPLKYDFDYLYHQESFTDGLAIVTLNKKVGFIDKTGKEIIPLKYDYANRFSEGLAHVELNDKHGFIDKTGKEVIPLKYANSREAFSEGVVSVSVLDEEGLQKWKVINMKDEVIISFKQLVYVDSFSEGLAEYGRVGENGFIDKTGKEIIPHKYYDVDRFSEGLAHVKLNGKHGFIDKTGKEVIPIKYDNADSFSEGLANVELNGKCGFIDKTGKEIIPLKYDSAQSFSEGLARVGFFGLKSYYIDKNGTEYYEP